MAKFLEAKNVCIRYPLYGGLLTRAINYVEAVSNVSFSMDTGEILAVVGESGCGKSTLAQALVGLVPWTSGELLLEGDAVDVHSEKSWKNTREKIQMIFQDPYSSLNPRHTVREILTYPLTYKGVASAEREARAKNVLEQVGIPQNALDKYSHEFSGGQRQRLGIARALMMNPRVLICDEVTSALDVSVQAQVLHLLDSLRKELNLAMIFISHDIQVVRVLSDRVMVMYKGKVMEEGPACNVLRNPQHDYTKKLIASVPTIEFR